MLSSSLARVPGLLQPEGEHIHRCMDSLLIHTEAAADENDIVRHRNRPCDVRLRARQRLPLAGEGRPAQQDRLRGGGVEAPAAMCSHVT